MSRDTSLSSDKLENSVMLRICENYIQSPVHRVIFWTMHSSYVRRAILSFHTSKSTESFVQTPRLWFLGLSISLSLHATLFWLPSALKSFHIFAHHVKNSILHNCNEKYSKLKWTKHPSLSFTLEKLSRVFSPFSFNFLLTSEPHPSIYDNLIQNPLYLTLG